VPLGLFLALPRLVVPHLGRREIARRDRRATRRIAQFRVAAEVSDEDDFVHTTHSIFLSPTFSAGAFARVNRFHASQFLRRQSTINTPKSSMSRSTSFVRSDPRGGRRRAVLLSRLRT